VESCEAADEPHHSAKGFGSDLFAIIAHHFA
jgi:hypothetical protein